MLKKFLLGQYSLKTSVYVHFCTWFSGIGVLLIFSSFNFLYFYLLTLIFTMIGLLNSSINYIKEKKKEQTIRWKWLFEYCLDYFFIIYDD
jgi:hypothetical protein